MDRGVFEGLLKEAGAYEGRIGWDASAVYPKTGTKVAEVAAIQEYGDPAHNIPSRSFFRSTIAEKQSYWKQLSEKGARAVLAGNETVKTAFTKMVLGAEGDVVTKITTLQEPPLKEATVLARKRRRKDQFTEGLLRKPLVDTGHMLATLTSTVDGVIIPDSNVTKGGGK